MNIDIEELAAVVRLLRDAEFSEFRYAKGDVSLVVRRGELSPEDGGLQPQPTPGVSSPPQSLSSGASQAAQPPAVAGRKPLVSVPESVVPQGPSSTVKAPLLGSFYSAPKPGEPPFVRVGDRVEPNTVICIIEVMKLMNSVEAGLAGIISAIHATDGELVEHGQVLFTIKPAGSA